MKFRNALCMIVLTAPPVFSAHFDQAKLTIRLIDPDSITMQVEADRDDFLNTVHTFPYEDTTLMRLYQKRIEDYLLVRIPMKVDGIPLSRLRVIQWKPEGKGRGDGFDSASLNAQSHAITLGCALPKQRKILTLTMNLWLEFETETSFQVSLVWKDTLLERRWTSSEKPLKFPVSKDSLMTMIRRSRNR